ncbi:hypothetical protein BGZ73_004211 [Actinomortierella ambigua]|nr:hypothetical protein BGZ73_004211 [Actinomortierella ambigua]
MNPSAILARSSLVSAASSSSRLALSAARLHSPAVTVPARTFTFSSSKSPDAKTGDSNASSSSSSHDSTDSSSKPLGKVSGLVNTILHGSGSGPKMQSQESWGVSLARGKYVHELQKHHVRPERFDDYVKLL